MIQIIYNMKNFEYKLFALNSDYKGNFTHIVRSKIALDAQINGGLGEVKIEIDDEEKNFFVPSDIVKIILYDEKNKNGKIFFSWVITEIQEVYHSVKKEISVSVLGLAVFLQKWMWEKTYTGEKKEVLREIIADYNSLGKFNFENVEFEGEFLWNISKKSVRNTYFSNFLTELCAEIDAYWRVDAEGKIVFSEKSYAKTHFFAMNGEIFDIKIEKKFDVLDFLNGRPQEKSTQITMEIRETEAVDFGDLLPWDTVKILNIDENFDNTQIHKISYNEESIRLELGDITSLFKEILEKWNEE